MSRPIQEPIGLLLHRAAKATGRAFDDALVAAGGSRPTWVILLALKRQPWETQAELARALDISSPTLTHHLDGLERDGVVTRTRDPDNRRVQVIQLTDAGDALFERLREAAMAFDERLRVGIDERDLIRVRAGLQQLLDNAGGDPDEA